MRVTAADQVVAVQIMKFPRHFPESLGGIQADNLRCVKALARCQMPLKALRMNAHHHAHTVELTQLCLCQEISGIHEIHRIHFAHLLIGAWCHKRKKWIFLMA